MKTIIEHQGVDALLGVAVVACVIVSGGDAALAQSLAPITNKVTSGTTQLVGIGQAAGGLTAAGAMIGWMFNFINWKWLAAIGGGGAGLASISTIQGWVNS